MIYVLFFTGLLVPRFATIDSSFGLAYYFLDSIGLWRPGPQWVTDNRFLAIFCALIHPIIVTALFSAFAVVTFGSLWNRSKQLGLLSVLILLLLVFGFQSSDHSGISYIGYLTANY